VVNTLILFRNRAVDFIDWLGLSAWLIDQHVVVRTLAVKCPASTARTSPNVAAKDLQLAFSNAAVMARLPICSPVFLFLAVANALKASPPMWNIVGIPFSITRENRPNENKLSDRRRERVWLGLELF
jgi:hypothetical protein